MIKGSVGVFGKEARLCEQYLAHNWDLLEEALDAFGEDENPIRKGAEWCDVTIRCYLLANAISEALDELEEEYPEEDESDEEADGLDD